MLLAGGEERPTVVPLDAGAEGGVEGVVTPAAVKRLQTRLAGHGLPTLQAVARLQTTEYRASINYYLLLMLYAKLQYYINLITTKVSSRTISIIRNAPQQGLWALTVPFL